MSLSVANFDIQNASGQNVRLDIQAAFKALQGQSAESADLNASQCVAGMTFLNTSTNILKVRNSANNDFTDIGNINSNNLGLLPRAGGTMTGVLKIDDSNSASTPALSFDTDPDTGLFRKAANKIGLSTGGTEQMFFDSDGITLQLQNNLRFADSDSSHYIALKAPTTVSSNVTLTLPATDTPVAGYALVSNGSGTLSWGVAGGASQGIFWENDQTVTSNYTITNGKNAMSAGPITIQNGVTVTIGSGETWTVV
mgnify:CR=1 FL=1|tara:strand:+ start:4167 stop:4928 length:762 start_codon:yes stop_codon:yes gene_type:complete